MRAADRAPAATGRGQGRPWRRAAGAKMGKGSGLQRSSTQGPCPAGTLGQPKALGMPGRLHRNPHICHPAIRRGCYWRGLQEPGPLIAFRPPDLVDTADYDGAVIRQALSSSRSAARTGTNEACRLRASLHRERVAVLDGARRCFHGIGRPFYARGSPGIFTKQNALALLLNPKRHSHYLGKSEQRQLQPKVLLLI